MSGRIGRGPLGQRRDRLVEERVHDPYRTAGRPKEPVACPVCGVVSVGGRWKWPKKQRPKDAEEQLCPACLRIRDRVPAGILRIAGDFLHKHEKEIMNLLENRVAAERAQRPLKRIMSIESNRDGITVQFTDRHLPRDVGKALVSAYQGELDIKYTEEAGIVRVDWRRD